MESHSVESLARCGAIEPPQKVLPHAQEKSDSLDSQSGEQKQFAQSKFAKQRRWKEKKGDSDGNKNKTAQVKAMRKVRKDLRKQPLGPQAGLSEEDNDLPADCLSEHALEEGMCSSYHCDMNVETVDEDGNSVVDEHNVHQKSDTSECHEDVREEDWQMPHVPYPFTRKLHHDMYVSGKYGKFVRNACSDLDKQLRDAREAHDEKERREDLVAMDPMRAVRAAMKNMGLEQKEVLNIFENMVVLYMKLSRDKTWADIALTLAMYAKTFTRESFLAIATESLLGVLRDTDSGLQPQSGDPAPQWLKVLRDANTKWQLVRANPAFDKVSKLVSICVALGICEITAFGFDLSSLGMFAESSKKVQYTATDLVGAALSTFVHFMETGYLCFETGSLKPLFYGNLDTQRFQDLYQRCLVNYKYHECGNLYTQGKIEDETFAFELEQCIDMANSLSKLSVGSFEKAMFLKYRDNVLSWQASFNQSRVFGGMRIAPYTIGIYGGTAVGKSSLANILMICTLAFNGFSHSPERIVTVNESDKYDSNLTSAVTGIHMDDVGNTKSDFVQEPTTDKIIRFCNNVPTQAVKADLAQKGKVAISPKVVVITKNVKDSCATVYSNEPTSIIRRENITLTVKVKDEYQTDDMLDPRKVFAKCPADRKDLPDLWEILVEKAYPVASAVEGRTPYIGFKTVGGMEKVGIDQLLEWVKEDSKQYFAAQRELITNSASLGANLQLCPKCGLPSMICKCPPVSVKDVLSPGDELDKQAGYTVQHFYDSWTLVRNVYRTTQRARTWINTMSPAIRLALTGVDGMLGTDAYARVQNLEDNIITCILSRLPGYFVDLNVLVNSMIMRKIMSSRISMYAAYYSLCLVVLFMTLGVMYSHAVWLVAWVPVALICIVLAVERELLYARVVRDRESTERIITRFRDSHAMRVGALCVGLYAAYKVVKFVIALNEGKKATEIAYSKFSLEMFGQGNIDPDNDEDIELRDLQENVWAVPKLTKMPVTERMKTITVEQLVNKSFGNLVHITLRTKTTDRVFCTNGFFLCSNVLLIPKHVMDVEDDMHMSLVRNGYPGGRFTYKLSRDYMIPVEGHDLVVTWVPSGGEWCNLLDDYITLEKPRDSMGVLVHKTVDGEKLTSPLNCTFGEQRSKSFGAYFGAIYSVCFPTFKGLCMSVVVADVKSPRIIGFHVAGRDRSHIGSCASPTCSELKKAVDTLFEIAGTLRAVSSGTMKGEALDVQFFEGETIHPKSPLNFIPEDLDTSFKAYGSVIGRAKTYSKVVPTPMSDAVAKHCGVPQLWGKPKFGVGYPWQKALVNQITPAIGVEGSYLYWAVNDYATHLIHYIDMYKKLSSEIVPLTREETVNGKLGKRFIDKMPGSTAIGYPLTGPKSRYYFDVEEPEDKNRTECVDLPEIFWKEADRLEDIYLRGERAYPVNKACFKDEPTPLTKDKVRVFQALPVAFQLIIRKYFLPIARVMSMLPLQSESAVGINSMGPEWDQLHRFVVSHGEDRILAGDYKMYDLKMPAQLSQAAFSILIKIAEYFGYSQEHLCIMRGIATDLTYPLVAFNGDLIGFHNTNPSGHNLTVYINCIVNSLLLRCAFCAVYGVNPDLRFREVCALMTYGDDCISSVNEQYPEFNHCAVAKYLDSCGMKFTMPDKESDPVPYLHMRDCDFLKRKSVYHSELGYYIGALDEMSIFKSLHSVLQSDSVTLKEQMISNLDGAAREFFCHGKEVYDKRIQELRAVAKEMELDHACRELGYTYEDRIAKWKEQYIEG